MKSVVLLVAILFVFILGFSQVESNDKGCKMKFGFNLGVNYPNLQLKEASPSSAKISNGIGFRLGVLMDYTISKSLIFSPK